MRTGTPDGVVSAAPGRASAGATDPCGRAINCTLARVAPAGSSLTGVGVKVSRTWRGGMGAAWLDTVRVRGGTATALPGPSGIARIATGARARGSSGRLGPAPTGGLNTSRGLRGTTGVVVESRAGPSDSAITFIGRSTVRIPESVKRSRCAKRRTPTQGAKKASQASRGSAMITWTPTNEQPTQDG